MNIWNWVTLNKKGIRIEGLALPVLNNVSPKDMLSLSELPPTYIPIKDAGEVYSSLGCNYSKFFKMDKLCKWAFVASEMLIGNAQSHPWFDKNKVCVALSTSHGCLDSDKRYVETLDIPSPALFVYTLPNIMLGEICIRHGFKGEQLCMVSECFDPQELHFAASYFLTKKKMDACVCGWVDVRDDTYDIALFLVTRKGDAHPCTAANIQDLYTRDKAD